jgi:dual specificity MAP kinase phosphatase
MRIGRPSSPAVYAIDGDKLAAAIAHRASQPLPDASLMFPWLHGLHRDNQLQLGFFTSRKRQARHTPKCWRGLTVVKLGGDLSKSRIKGAVSPHEVLAPSSHFLMADPPEGFSVRNFQIQTAKLAAMSDIVIYAEDDNSHSGLVELANQFAKAQRLWRTKMDPLEERPTYNTFILAGSLLYPISRIHGLAIDILPQTSFPMLPRNIQRSLPSMREVCRPAKLWISVTSKESWGAWSLC